MEYTKRKLFACQRGQYVRLAHDGIKYRVINPADGMFARLSAVGNPPHVYTNVPAWVEVYV